MNTVTTKQKIRQYVLKNKHATAKELREAFGVSQVLIHRHLKTLCDQNILQKIGSPPKVFYTPAQKILVETHCFSKIIEKNWLEIFPDGRFLYGCEGFLHWCKERNKNVDETEKEYEKIFLSKEEYKKNGLIDATEKITKSFVKNYLEKLWYVDFYSWEIFGKTKLGSLILYAKQNSDVGLMKSIAKIVQAPIENLLVREQFDMIGIIPHSVSRKRDFLKTTLNFLSLSPPPQKVFEKIFVEHSVAQKTLKSKKAREQNAESTLFLTKKTFPQKILLIDDACGSGATLNIAAQKIKEKSPNTKIYALTFVGSIKGFEVIAES